MPSSLLDILEFQFVTRSVLGGVGVLFTEASDTELTINFELQIIYNQVIPISTTKDSLYDHICHQRLLGESGRPVCTPDAPKQTAWPPAASMWICQFCIVSDALLH